MPTLRLYRDNSYQRHFEATITDLQHSQDNAGQVVVSLDQSAFYPTAGGQQHDKGSIAGFAVIDVQNGPDDTVLHWLATPADGLAVGQSVAGVLDWARRFDFMQQHSGEHMLGQAFFRLGHHVIAVSMGETLCTLDLADSVDEDTIWQAETSANQAIYAAHAITCYEIDDSAVASLPLRRPPQVSGRIRIVQMGDYDYSACGGTHLANTSEVGIIKILKAERVKGGATRISFHCGLRALFDYRFKHQLVQGLARRFSVQEQQLAPRLEQGFSEQLEDKRQVASLREQLAQAQVALWQQGAELCGSVRLLVQQVPDSSSFNDLAKAVAQYANTVAVFSAVGERTFLAVASNSSLNANSLLQAGLGHIGGKGGGKPTFAQGSGLNHEGLSDALAAIRTAVSAGG
jgi:alanyl-tRNA synthetase